MKRKGKRSSDVRSWLAVVVDVVGIIFSPVSVGQKQKARQKEEVRKTDRKTKIASDILRLASSSGQSLLTIIYPGLFVSLTNHGFVPFPPAPLSEHQTASSSLFLLQPLL